jgi:hypothetical protein
MILLNIDFLFNSYLIIMKFILCLFLILQAGSLHMRTSTSQDADYITIWKNLFSTLERPSSTCSTPEVSKNAKNNLNSLYQRPVGVNPNMPYSKSKNPFSGHGFEESADMFDYLDDIFQKDISNYFTTMYKEALNIPEADGNTYQDPYSIDKLIQSNEPSLDLTKFNIDQKLDLVQKYIPIDKNSFKTSISPARLYNIISQWNWSKPNIDDYARKLVDAYDLTGDGRLNAYEFLALSIILNKNFAPAKYSFNEIFKSKLDPIFYYLDCDSDGMISGENVWYGFGKLKRSTDKYNIYNCDISDPGKNLMTMATNDFVLKNDSVLSGYVNQFDFRTGLLLGFLNRQVRGNNVVTDDSVNEKSTRWTDGGAKETMCEKFKKFKTVKPM